MRRRARFDVIAAIAARQSDMAIRQAAARRDLDAELAEREAARLEYLRRRDAEWASGSHREQGAVSLLRFSRGRV